MKTIIPSTMPSPDNRHISPALQNYFEDAYRNHLRKVQFYAFNYLSDEAEARNVAHDVFLTLWENLGEIDSERDILPYLLTITKFKCMNIMRSKNYHRKFRDNEFQKHTKNSIAYAALSDYTSTALYSDDIQNLVSKSLEEMPEKIKSTYMLSRHENMKNKEIAQLQVISIKTVEYRLNYALKILRKNLHDYLYLFFFVSLLFL